MRITNFNIENFRNIVKANANFGQINIFTGRNSSGKSNLLLALSASLKTNLDFSDIFYDNVVTFGPGKSKTIFKTTIGDLNSRTVFYEKEEGIYFRPEFLTFENTFGKKGSSPVHHSLLYTGGYLKKSFGSDVEPLTPGKPRVSLDYFENSKDIKQLVDQLVYERDFIKEKPEINNGREFTVKNIQKNYDEPEKFFSTFEAHIDSIFSWVNPKMFSSTSIFLYVTERIDNSEIYDQVINYLKEKEIDKNRFSSIPFAKARFINLLADVQKNEKQNDEFHKDLKIYTKGLVNKVQINLDGSIGNKGEIFVESVNSPRDLFCISAGTAVLIYFILLKNWLNLPYQYKSYVKPEIMIFDEVDSIIHPSLMNEFKEVIRGVSKFIQLFISTHSPHFIDCFEKNEVYWIKDNLSEKNKAKSDSNIYSYEEIIKKMPSDNSYFLAKNNSELFIDGLMDSIFPLI